jgi:hypothetical protein
MYLDPHLEHRKAQERDHAEKRTGDPMDSLVSIEVNVMDACNRTCTFCPHGNANSYPNHYDWKASPELIQALAVDLKGWDYKGRISFSGYGEPLLNKALPGYIAILREALPQNTIEVNTNGDALNAERITTLYAAGLSLMYVNMYDGPEQKAHFWKMFHAATIGEWRYRLRPHWPSAAPSWGLTVNNRSGTVESVGKRAEPWMGKPCNYPFYKLYLDWDANFLFCANDWGRVRRVGSLYDPGGVRAAWLSEEMKAIRLRLDKGDRSQSPCNVCDVHGTLHGQSSHDLLMAYYNGKAEAAE